MFGENKNKKIKRQLCLFGREVCLEGSSETERRRKIRAEANKWKEMEGVMGDRYISRIFHSKYRRSSELFSVWHGMSYTLHDTPLQQITCTSAAACDNDATSSVTPGAVSPCSLAVSACSAAVSACSVGLPSLPVPDSTATCDDVSRFLVASFKQKRRQLAH